MKTEEIRYGNWFRFKAEYCLQNPEGKARDFQIDDEEFRYLSEGDMRPDEHFEPILITKEWLEKLGFKRVPDWIEDRFANPHETHDIYSVAPDGWQGFSIHFVRSNYGGIEQSDIDARWDDGILRSVQYIHQIQNLYFDLTDQELCHEKKDITG